MAAGAGPWETELLCPGNGGMVLSTRLWKCTTMAPTCLFQAPHVSLGMASLAGSRLEQCGGAGSSCSVHSCLSLSLPGPHFSLLCWPYLFTKHFSVLHPEAYSL